MLVSSHTKLYIEMVLSFNPIYLAFYNMALCIVFVNKKVLQKGVKKVSTFNTQ